MGNSRLPFPLVGVHAYQIPLDAVTRESSFPEVTQHYLFVGLGCWCLRLRPRPPRRFGQIQWYERLVGPQPSER